MQPEKTVTADTGLLRTVLDFPNELAQYEGRDILRQPVMEACLQTNENSAKYSG